jgi:hypothetical protein
MQDKSSAGKQAVRIRTVSAPAARFEILLWPVVPLRNSPEGMIGFREVSRCDFKRDLTKAMRNISADVTK